MNTVSQSQSDATQTFTRPAAKVGDTVRYRYFLDPLVGTEEFIGEIDDVKADYLSGYMYHIVPRPGQTFRFNLAPRWLQARYIREIIVPVAETPSKTLYDDMKAAEKVFNEYAALDTWDLPADHATYKRKVAAHITYLRAQAAYLGTSNEALIAHLYGASKTIPAQTAAPQDVETIAVQTAAPLFPKEAQLSDRDKAMIKRHVDAAVEQFGLKDLPAPAEKQDWRVEFPSLVQVQQHRLNEARKAK